MAKAPAFQFYVRDWLSDPELQSASCSSRGIWINALCYMWEARERGKLEGSVQSFARLLNCTEEEFQRFLDESQLYHFDELEINLNGKVTLTNRRMQREDKKRFYHNKRQDRYRQRHIINIGDAKSDAEMTPCSSSSSSKNKEYSSFFLQFWKIYPKKNCSKKSAFSEWEKARKNSTLPDITVLLEALNKQIAHKKALLEAGQFCPEWPDAERWIKKSRWEDEMETYDPINPYANYERV